MIEINHLGKVFESKTGSIVALDNINLKINDGEIFGIIGLSGAGKSTLVRCINLLEKPTSGEVVIDGRNIVLMPKKELLKLRQSIGDDLSELQSSGTEECDTKYMLSS